MNLPLQKALISWASLPENQLNAVRSNDADRFATSSDLSACAAPDNVKQTQPQPCFFGTLASR
ncbi:hypothetical protein [Mariniphaga anaerophila]|uniref:hypothetical protein n=1 Tax=Mariniphaga anaerophila TaxID=1484053 RepID=UPI001114BD7A|nr:hypothetical protein [Mariniphaga anaerophila]